MPSPMLAPRYFAPSYFGGLAPTIAPSIFEEDLLAYLQRVTGLRVYPGHIPQNANLPALSLFLVSGDHLHKLSGAAGQATDRFQIAVSSRSYLDVGRVSERVRGALDGFRGVMGGSRVNSTVAGNHFTGYDAAVDGSDRGVHSKIREFTFAYRESIPF